MKKTIALILVLAMFACLFTGCSEKAATPTAATPTAAPSVSEAPATASYEWKQVGSVENVKIVEQEPERALKFAFLGYSNNSFWDLIYEGVDNAAEFLKQHNVTIDKINLGTEIGADVMNNALESCMLQGYDGIICTTLVTGCEKYINDCVDAGIPVGIIVGEGSESKRNFLIAGGASTTYNLAAEHIDQALNGEKGATFAVVVAQFSLEATEVARNNVISILEGKGYECVGSFEAHDSADECYSITEQLLTAHPDLGAIYCVSGGTYGIPKAVVDAGKAGEVYIFGNDEIAENLEYVREGVMDVVGQNPHGSAFDAFMYLYNIVVAGQYPEETNISAASPIITADNVNELFPK